MKTLGNIASIENSISHAKVSAIKALHIICFRNEGEPRKARGALRRFSGFNFNADSEELTEKIEDIKKRLSLSDLIAVCNVLYYPLPSCMNNIQMKSTQLINSKRLKAMEDKSALRFL